MKNIRTFLKVCHDKFGLRNSDLFDPFDLFDVRDFGKVSCLFPGWPRPPLGRTPWAGAGRAVLQPAEALRGLGLQDGSSRLLKLFRVKSGIVTPGGWMDGHIDGWMGGWTDVWMGGWMDRQTDGWMGG